MIDRRLATSWLVFTGIDEPLLSLLPFCSSLQADDPSGVVAKLETALGLILEDWIGVSRFQKMKGRKVSWIVLYYL